MHKITNNLLLILVVLLTLVSCKDQEKVMTTEGGVRYKVLSEGDTQQVKVGDIMMFDYTVTDANDSVLTSTYGKQQAIFKIPQPRKGDLEEAFLHFHVGDSVMVLMNVDSLKRRMVPVPPTAKAGTDLRYTFKVDKILTPEELEAEQAKMIAKQEKMLQKRNVEEVKIIEKYLADNNIEVKKEEGVYYTITQGTGKEKALQGDTIKVHYILRRLGEDGKLIKQPIENSYDSNQPFEMIAGVGMVIKGWDLALTKIVGKGEKARLYIPSMLAYGPQNKGPLMPANSILVFDVEVLEKE